MLLNLVIKSKGKWKVYKKKIDMDRKIFHSGSLLAPLGKDVMPNSDPRDRFFCPHLTIMKYRIFDFFSVSSNFISTNEHQMQYLHKYNATVCMLSV